MAKNICVGDPARHGKVTLRVRAMTEADGPEYEGRPETLGVFAVTHDGRELEIEWATGFTVDMQAGDSPRLTLRVIAPDIRLDGLKLAKIEATDPRSEGG